MLSTYYVYDDLGRLAFVLPPASGADADGTFTTATLNNLCYQYRYDERGRPEAKRLPGKGWEYTVYNIMDQPVATQDSLQGINKQWIFTKYDDRQRVAVTGIWNNGGTSITRASLQSTLNGISTNLWETPITTGNGYTNVAWPTTSVTTTLSVNYYDGNSMPGVPSAFTAPTGADLSVRSELTGTQTNVLGTSNMLWTAHYYDYWGRSLESYAQHYLNGTLSANNYDAITSTYDFTNAPTTVTRKHWTSASTANPLVTIFNKYIYDWVGRKQKTWEQITNGSSAPDTLRLVSNTTYNEIGQMAFKKLDSKDSVNFMQSINYKYNERGWLLSSSTSLFAMTLYYNTNAGNKAYNGNIMYQYWGVPGNLSNHYTYTYDELNRLTSGITSADNYQESGITYDIQGNLSALNRYQAGTQIDQLSYSYIVSGNPTNQLQTVVDANGSNSGLVSGTTNYTYDGNGNMLTATNTINSGQNKNISYNLLNLPLVVTVPNGTDTYTYDAAGNKLRMVKVIGGVTTNTDYIGGIQYNGSTSSDTLSFIQTEEGKAVHNGTTYDYQYYLSDNLGNTRITFNTKKGIAKTIQQDDYYPFGLEILRAGPHDTKNEYLYNKKELQEDFTEYDYGARYYDPILGRWTSLDPLAEVSRRWSTYNYVEDDPIRLTDPDGMNVVYNPDGSVTYNNDGGSDDATNFAWGLKIADDPNKKKKDDDRKKAQEEKKKKEQEEKDKNDITKLAYWTNWKAWLDATPVLGGADKAGDELSEGNYWNAAADEGSAMLEMFTFVESAASGTLKSAWDSFAGLFTKDAATDLTATAAARGTVLTRFLEKMGYNTNTASEFFGWGSKTKGLTKTIGDFTKQQLIDGGWTRENLIKLGEAYEEMAAKSQAASNAGRVNTVALARAKQAFQLAEHFFGK